MLERLEGDPLQWKRKPLYPHLRQVRIVDDGEEALKWTTRKKEAGSVATRRKRGKLASEILCWLGQSEAE